MKSCPVAAFGVAALLYIFRPVAAVADETATHDGTETIVNVADFGVKADGKDDVTFAVAQALQACRAVRNPVLLFPKGVYHFYPDLAREKYYSIANNWHKAQRVALPLWDFDGLTVDGQGSDIIMHQMILPIVIDHSTNVTIRNLAIDWQRPSLSQGEVLASDEAHFDVRIAKEYPYKIVGGELIFTDGPVEYPLRDFLEFDPRTRATAYQVQDAAGGGRPTRAEELSPGVVRLSFKKMRTPPAKGNIVVLRGGLHRESPAIFCVNSKNIVSENVNIYTARGMGFIAQRCENVALHRTNVRVREGSDRLFSCDADATHFVYCRGQILIEGCLFENQLDDAGNIHGIYTRVERKIDDHNLLMRLVHPEQVGVEVMAPGEHVRLVDNHTMESIADAMVKAVQVLNVDYFILTLEDAAPPGLRPHNVIENLDWQPDLTIRNCVTRRNRARGFLIGTAGKVLIENNTMDEPGSCLLMGVDANYWFESGPVTDVTVRSNEFLNPTYGVWGKRAISFGAENFNGKPYEKNITIEGNLFRLFNIGVFGGSSIDGLNFLNNTIERTSAYPPTQKAPWSAVSLHGCQKVEFSHNTCVGVPVAERDISVDGAVVGHLGPDATIQE